MQVITKAIHVLGYETETVDTRRIDDGFDGYIRHLIYQMDRIKNIREYCSKALTTQVVSSAILVYQSVTQGDQERMMVSQAQSLAARLPIRKGANCTRKNWSYGSKSTKGKPNTGAGL